ASGNAGSVLRLLRKLINRAAGGLRFDKRSILPTISYAALMKTYLIPLLIIALPLSGCSAAYIMGEYGQSSGREVRLSCHRTYRVYE
ncbi:hypothetical protein C4M77_28410, partial [Escherichia coli]